MANKQKKKRDKKYTGSEASAPLRPTVTRISAVHHNPVQQWWIDNRRIAKPVSIAVALSGGLIWLIFEIIRVVNAF